MSALGRLPAPVEVGELTVPEALPLPEVRVAEARTRSTGQSRLLAERGGAVQQAGGLTACSLQRLDDRLADVADPDSGRLAAGLDVDRREAGLEGVRSQRSDRLEDSPR